MPAPKGRDHRTASIEIIRRYEPDEDRMVAAIMRLLKKPAAPAAIPDPERSS